jgi:hypothetical protein
MKTAISSCDALHFLYCIGGLQVWPPNQAHTARLDEVARIAGSISQWGDRKPRSAELGELLNKIVPTDGPIGRLEDPLTGLFTDNAIFLKANFTCYPGINQDGPWILKILSISMSMNSSTFPRPFLRKVASASKALLSLTDRIASRLGHPRYMDSPDTSGSDIEVPDDEILQRCSQAVVFSEEELCRCLSNSGLDALCLAPFVTELGTLDEEQKDPDDNPIILKPLIRVGDTVVVVSPGSIVHAVRHFIFRSAMEFEVLELLAEKYRKTLWIFIGEHMRLLSLGPVECDRPSGSVGAPVEESLFTIDADKVAYVQLISDDMSNFNPGEPCGVWECEDLGEVVEKRAASVVEWLTGGGNSYCRSVLLIYVLGSMGRDIFFGIQSEPPNAKVIALSAQDLEVIIQLQDLDNLALWKFSEADRALREKSYVLSPDFLDLYAVYKSYRDSFYLSDDPLPDFGVVPVGKARSLRIKATRRAHVHFSPRFGTTDAVLVGRLEEDEAIPVYYPERDFGRTLDRLVEGYNQPIWVECNDQAQKNSPEVWSLHRKLTDMLAYWLWQLTPSLRPHLVPFGDLPLRINFRLTNPELWPEISGEFKTGDLEASRCRTSYYHRTLFLEVPADMAVVLYGADNRGERLILDDIMVGLAEMLAGHGFEITLTGDERQRILDAHAPLGRKKRLVLIRTGGRASLVPKHLPVFRKLQVYNVEHQLDNIVSELKSRPGLGEVPDVERCKSVCGELVDIYLHRIRELLSKFSWESLVTTFIAQHEAYCHYRILEEITTPTNIECYGDVIPQLQRLISDLRDAEYAAEALRLLIEIVAAEPPNGELRLNLGDLDTLVAMAFNLINWAILSDNIAWGILDYRLSILASGRIGVKKLGPREVWDPFIRAKSVEGVEAAIREFDNRFVKDLSSEKKAFDSSGFDPAFKAEFGLTFSDIASFHHFFTNLGYAQDSAVASVLLSELRHLITRDLRWPDEKIQTAFELFTLKPRPKWEEAPPGFNRKEDVEPWRANRRLSYLRRPLIQGPASESGPLILWGSRHVDEALRHLLGLVYTGRYKIQEGSSEEMKKLISSLQNKSGEEFVTDVIDWLQEHVGWTCHRKVEIGPRKRLKATEYLGDVDVLCIDPARRRIFSIECKNINFARNPREIRNELERFLGDKDPADSWIARHQKRHQWLQENFASVQAAFALDQMPLQAKSLVLTSEEIPSAYIRDMPLPFVSFSYLRREGVEALENI